MRSTLQKLCLSLVGLTVLPGSAAGAPVLGDIAVIGIHADDTKRFSWVPLVDLAEGAVFWFTDSGVLQDGSIRGNEGTVTFTVPSGGIAAGTVQVETGLTGLALDGDQVIVYSGSDEFPTFIFAAQTNSSQFQINSNDSNQSDLPPGLTVGTTAVAVGPGAGAESEVDNAYYTGAVTSGTRAELLAAFADASNWTSSNDPIADITNGVTSYSITAVPEPSGFLFLGFIAVIGVPAQRLKMKPA